MKTDKMHPAIREFKQQFPSNKQAFCVQAATLVGIAVLREKPLTPNELSSLAHEALSSPKPLSVLLHPSKRGGKSTGKSRQSAQPKSSRLRRSTSHKRSSKIAEPSNEKTINRGTSQHKSALLKHNEWNLQLYGNEGHEAAPLIDYFASNSIAQKAFASEERLNTILANKENRPLFQTVAKPQKIRLKRKQEGCTPSFNF